MSQNTKIKTSDDDEVIIKVSHWPLLLWGLACWQYPCDNLKKLSATYPRCAAAVGRHVGFTATVLQRVHWLGRRWVNRALIGLQAGGVNTPVQEGSVEEEEETVFKLSIIAWNDCEANIEDSLNEAAGL